MKRTIKKWTIGFAIDCLARAALFSSRVNNRAAGDKDYHKGNNKDNNKGHKKISWRHVGAVALVVTALHILPAVSYGDEVLRLYNFTDYTPTALLKKFEKETGIKVSLDTYDTNDNLLAKLKEGRGGYDLAVAGNDYVPILIKDGLIQKVVVANMANYKYVDKKWQNPKWDRTQQYTVPYQMGTQSFAFRTSRYDGKGNSWREFLEPDEAVRGKIAVFNDAGKMVNAAHLYLGQDICSENPRDYQAVEALLSKQKPYVKVYSSQNMTDRLKSGEVIISSAWDGSAKRGVYESGMKDLHYAFPKEGMIGFFDSMVIPSGAKNKLAAEKFMNFVMKPENVAMISNAQGYGNAIPASKRFLSKDMRQAQSLLVPKGQKIIYPLPCGEKAIRYTNKVWTNIQR